MSPTTHTLPFDSAVVGDDGREGGDLALGAAAYLQSKLGLKIRVVHSIDLPALNDVGKSATQLLPKFEAISESATEWLENRVAERLPDPAESHVELVPPRSALLRSAHSMPAKLAVIGHHVKDSLFDFGGTQRGLFSSDVPYIWHQTQKLKGVHRIVVPHDPRSSSDAAAILGRDLAAALGVPLVTVCCSEPPVFAEPMVAYMTEANSPDYVVESLHGVAKERFMEWHEGFDWGDAGAKPEFLIGPVISTLADYCEETDLMVMGTQGKTGIAAAFVGGTTYAIIKRGVCPVLTVKTKLVDQKS